MPYAEGARFDSGKGCLPGTREGIINRIVEWINSSDGDSAQRIFSLSGVAGSGKSAIAHAVAKSFYEQKRLGSSYCFARDDQGKRHPRNLFSTIALDIADLDSQWKQFLCEVVEGDRALGFFASFYLLAFILKTLKKKTDYWYMYNAVSL
jgi:hypothetical protein